MIKISITEGKFRYIISHMMQICEVTEWSTKSAAVMKVFLSSFS